MMKSIAFTGFIAVVCISAMSMSKPDGPRIKVYLQNKCSTDVSIRIDYPGGSMNYTVDDNSNKPDTFSEGTKIFDSKKNLVHTVEKSSEGKTIVVCQ